MSTRYMSSLTYHVQDGPGLCGPACLQMYMSDTASRLRLESQAKLRRLAHAVRVPARDWSWDGWFVLPAELRAVLRARLRPRRVWSQDFRGDELDGFIAYVVTQLKHGHPCVVATDTSAHWMVAVGCSVDDHGELEWIWFLDPFAAQGLERRHVHDGSCCRSALRGRGHATTLYSIGELRRGLFTTIAVGRSAPTYFALVVDDVD